MRRLVFYTRGDASWGMGHLHRVTWMAEQFARQSHSAISPLIIRCVDSAEARRYWQSALPQLKPWTELEYLDTASLLEPSGGLGEMDTVVADWLDSEVDHVRQALRRGTRVVLLDEYGPAQGEADLVINSLLTPLPSAESVVGRATVVSGVAYLQLPPLVTALRQTTQAQQRETAWQLAGPAPWHGPVRAVLVSFGGTVRREATQCALEALAHAGYTGRVISMPAAEGLLIPPGLDVELHPAGPEFHDIFAACDLAVIAGGLTLYEAAYLGVPAVVMPVRSGAPGRELHQLDTARKLEQAGCCLAAGLAGTVMPDQLGLLLAGLLQDDIARRRMSSSGMRLIDGRGLQRTAGLIHGML